MLKKFGAKSGHGTIKDLVKKAAGKRSLGFAGMLMCKTASADQPGTGKHGGKKMTKYNPKTGDDIYTKSRGDKSAEFIKNPDYRKGAPGNNYKWISRDGASDQYGPIGFN